MMKLKHLFNNPSLAEMLVINWAYDVTSLEMFQYFRISANAIYPFKINGEVCFLRCSPTSEKLHENVLAELEFIDYLRDAQYNALEPVLSKTGDEWIQKSTPWGDYYASVFKRVKGEQISKTSLDDEIVFAYGTALGQLHKISSEYTSPKTRRWAHADIFNWIEAVLFDLGIEGPPLEELAILRGYFSRLAIHPDNYGLIHYDFETDNVFYDGVTKSCSVIDFDDAMYHWYVMDIVQALKSLQDELSEGDYVQKKTIFITGYESEFCIDQDLFAVETVFERFANLYGYARVVRAIQEKWENEPEWMVALRKKLTGYLGKASAQFGNAISFNEKSEGNR